MEKKKVVRLEDVLASKKLEAKHAQVTEVTFLLGSLEKEDRDKIVDFFFNWIELEVREGLGLDDYDDDSENPVFDMVNNIYQEAAAGCYFCDKTVDPNATEINKDTKFCWMCQLKLGNFVTALGLDPGDVFKTFTKGPRPVQKSRLNMDAKR